MANANGRDSFEPFDLPLTKRLKVYMDDFRAINEKIE